jgi:exosortase family protein XrtM
MTSRTDALPSSSPPPLSNGDWRFLLLLSALYGLFEFGYFLVPDPVLREVLHARAIAAPAAAAIEWLSPAEGVSAADGGLVSSTAALRIVRGCDGAGVAFLLVAAVLAFPAARATHRAAGVAGALALTYVLNEARVVILYFVASRRPDWFTPAHDYVLPASIILLCGLAFSAWVAWNSREEALP